MFWLGKWDSMHFKKKNNTKWKWIKISQDPLEGQMAGVSTLFEGEKIQ